MPAGVIQYPVATPAQPLPAVIAPRTDVPALVTHATPGPIAPGTPVNILVNTRRPPSAPRRPMPATGWFTRSFGTSLGAMLGIVVVLLGTSAIVCGGIYLLMADAWEEVKEETKRETDQATDMARTALEGYGLTELSDDVVEYDALLENSVKVVSGHAKTMDGEIKEFSLRFRVTKWDDEQKWELLSVTIDDKVVSRRKTSSD